MKKSKRLEDIQNRHSLALAEMQIYERGSRHYEQLSEIARIIRTEYQNTDARTKRNRYGFRLRGTDYQLVILDDCEKY